jgi:phage FluMu protein Com
VADIIVKQTPELVLPHDIEFACPHCKRLCKTNARTRGVKHSVPTCKDWNAITTPEGFSDLLVLAGVVQRLQ